MTPAEKEACSCLLKIKCPGYPKDNDDCSDVDEETISFSDRLFQRNKKRKQADKFVSKYTNAEYICGSTAEIEQVPSIFMKQCTNLSPLMLEFILYLNYNKDLWSDSDIRAA